MSSPENEKNIIQKSLNKTSEQLDTEKKELEKLARELEEKKKLFEKNHGLFSQEEFDKFVDSGEVSQEKLELLADKIKNREPLSDFEKAIHAGEYTGAEIAQIIQHKYPSPEQKKNLKKKTRESTKKLAEEEGEAQKEQAEKNGKKVQEDENKKESEKKNKENKDKELAKQKEKNDIAQEFRKSFGFDPNENLESFKDLEPGAQRLAYKSLQNVQASMVPKLAEEIYETKQKSFLNYFRKSALIEGNKKEAAEQLSKAGYSKYEKYLKQIVGGIKNTGLEGVADGAVGIRMEYAHGLENLTEEEKKELVYFNRAATKFGDIPREWAFDDANKVEKFLAGEFSSRNNKQMYQEAKEAYEREKEGLAKIVLEKFGGDEERATNYLRMIDANVEFSQRVASDPNAMAALGALSAQGNAISKKSAMSAASFGIGYLMRGGAATAGLANYAGLAVAPVLGALRGLYKGRQNIREAERNVRTGEELKESQKTKFNTLTGKAKEEALKRELVEKMRATYRKTEETKTSAKGKEMQVGLRQKLENALDSLESAQGQLEKIDAEIANEKDAVRLNELHLNREKVASVVEMRQTFVNNRLVQVQKLLDSGDLDFGMKSERFANEYAMRDVLNKAYAVAISAPLGENNKNLNAFYKKFNVFFAEQLEAEQGIAARKTENVKAVKDAMIRHAVVKGAVMSFIFAGLGFEVRDLYNNSELHNKVSEFFGRWKADNLEANSAPIKAEVGTDDEATEKVREMGKRWVDLDQYKPKSPLSHGDISKGVTVGHEHLEQATEKIENIRGISQDFAVTLGKNGVPAQLERVFHEISLDHMEVPNNALNEEVGAKSLNMAANLVRLSEGHNVLGASTESFKNSFSYDKGIGTLKIINHEKFNNLLDVLKTHSDKLWDNGTLQKGAAGELSNIKTETWLKIAHADDLDKALGGDGQEVVTGIHGHDEITEKDITDFHKSAIVEKTRALREKLAGKLAEHVDKAADVTTNTKTEFGIDPDTRQQSWWDGNEVSSTSATEDTINTAPSQDLGIDPDSKQQSWYGGNEETQTPSVPAESPKIEEVTGGNSRHEVIPEKTNTAEEYSNEVAEKAVKIPVETQNHSILSNITGKEDLSDSRLWQRAHDMPVADIFKQTETYIRDEASDRSYKKLWAYTQMLNRSSGVSILKNETLEDYLSRAGKVFTERNPGKSLDYVYELSQKYLIEVETK